MGTEQEPRPQLWSRWMPLVITSNSGKTMFVCLICGEVTPLPFLDCHKPVGGSGSTLLPAQRLKRDPRYTATWPDSQTCREIESRINETINRTTADRWNLDAVEDR